MGKGAEGLCTQLVNFGPVRRHGLRNEVRATQVCMGNAAGNMPRSAGSNALTVLCVVHMGFPQTRTWHLFAGRFSIVYSHPVGLGSKWCLSVVPQLFAPLETRPT